MSTKKIDYPSDIMVSIHDQKAVANLRTFKSGKKGYGVYGKQLINGIPCQVSCNVVIIGSEAD